MKTRAGFVSNSSSSSFIIMERDFIKTDTDMIINIKKSYGTLPEDFTPIRTYEGFLEAYDDLIDVANEEGWLISRTNGYVIFHSFLDNFDMEEHLFQKYGISDKVLSISAHSGFMGADGEGFEPVLKEYLPTHEYKVMSNLEQIVHFYFYDLSKIGE